MGIQSFEGIVLFTRKHREQDTIVKILTQDMGTRMFFVKNGEMSQNPLKSQLVPLTYNHYVGSIQQQGFSFLREANTIQFYRKIQSDYELFGYAVYLSQLVDAALDDGEIASEVYYTFRTVLDLMEAGQSPEILTIYLEIYLLERFGVAVSWTSCILTGRTEGVFDFSIRHSGIIHQSAWDQDPYRCHLSAKALKVAQILATTPIQNIRTINVSNETTQLLRTLMDTLYQEYVGIQLRGKSYLNQLRDMNMMVQSRQTKGESHED